MKRQITNLLVLPLIASAVLLSSPVFASDPLQNPRTEIRHKTNTEHRPRKGISGTVTSISGAMIIVTTEDDIQYNVDTSHATIMKAADGEENPSIVTISNIEVGDAILVRGEINDTEVDANKVFDGKMPHKHHKHSRKHT